MNKKNIGEQNRGEQKRGEQNQTTTWSFNNYDIDNIYTEQTLANQWIPNNCHKKH